MKKKLFVVLLGLLSISTTFAQDFMLQGWYWNYPKKDCPDAGTPTWASVLQGQVNSISQGGFTYVWLPPPTNSSYGQCSNGYDARDLYDLGDAAPTGIGTRADLDGLIATLNSAGVDAVADVIFNHRDGGEAETNNAVRDYITVHFDATTKDPYPSDRFRCVLPLGGASGNGAGDYYFKIKSKSGDVRFDFYEYKVYMQTNTVGWAGLADDPDEEEPNGGGDCSTPNDFKVISLGRNFLAQVDEHSASCRVDEFKLTLNSADFDSNGDFLYIYLSNTGAYSDHYIYDIWYDATSTHVIGQMEYQTYTDFTGMPSGNGSMNFENFRPNTATAATETLRGDWNSMSFFYDYDQSVTSTRTTLFDWTKWLWNDAGFRGFRMDAVKHFDYTFIGDLLDDLHYSSPSINPGMVVGEFFDGDAATLNSWITNVENNMDASTQDAIDVRLFDFSLRNKLKGVCDNNHDARDIFDAGMVAAGANSYNVVTFLNNHDLRKPYEPVWNDPMLAYAYLLTNNQVGLPCVFYAEYFGVRPNNDYPDVDLKTTIDELIAIHKAYIFNSENVDYLNRHGTGYHQYFVSGSDRKILIYQMAAGIGGKEIIVAVNFGDTALDMWQTINLDIDGDGTNNYGVNQTFTEVTNNYSSSTTLTVTALNNDVNIKLPAKSYAVWVQGAALPLELTKFEVKAEDKQVNVLWETQQEKDVTLFEVERSLDGIHFEKIGEKYPMNDLAQTNKYVLTDNNPIYNSTLYYRLKTLDSNGQFSYSSIVQTMLYAGGGIPHLNIYPNPASNTLFIEAEADIYPGLEVKLMSLLGEEVEVLDGDLSSGSIHEIDVSNLPKGVYFLSARNETGRWMEKVVVE